MAFSFLIASERTGSNLITKMLDAHSTICGPSPKHILRTFALEALRLSPFKDAARWEKLLDFLYQLLDSDFAVWASESDRDKLAGLVEIGDFPGLMRKIFEREAEAQEKRHVFIKELQVYSYIPFLDWCFPGARYVYLVRDPRDMALSWRDNAAHPGGIVAGSIQWRNDQAGSLVPYFGLSQQERAIIVRYEDLIKEPKEQLTRVCDFLGVSFEESMLDYHMNSLTQKNAQNQTAWRNLAEGVLEDNSEKFRKKLNAKEIAMIEVICGAQMSAYGYMPVSSQAQLSTINNQVVNEYHVREMKQYPARPLKGPYAHDVVLQQLRNIPYPSLLADG